MANVSLRKYMEAVLDYLGVPPDGQLRKELQKAPDEVLPKMYLEMSLALSETLDDPTLLKTIKIKMPDGTITDYEAAQKYARQRTPPNLGEKYENSKTPSVVSATKRARATRPRESVE